MTGDGDIRLGLIGLGPWGQKLAACLQDLSPRLPAAIATGNPALAASLAPEARIFADGMDLIADDALDGVVIATPPQTHAALALAAIGRHLPVLIEKPMATTIQDADRLCAAALAAQCPVGVNHLDLTHPAFRAVLRARPTIAPFHRIAGRITRRQQPNPKADALWDFAPHLVAMALASAEDAPMAITARRHVGPGIDRLVFRLKWRTAAPFTGIAGFGFGADTRQFRLFGTGGRLVYDDRAAERAILHRRGNQNPIAHDARTSPLRAALSHFIAQIRSGSTDPGPVLLGRRVVHCLVRIEAETHRRHS